MKNSLDEFMIEGINTTIPLYKTIMDDPNFIKGELSTDYLERFKILNKMNEDAKEAAKKSAKAAVAAVLLQSEFVRRSGGYQQSSVAKSEWKNERIDMQFKVGDLAEMLEGEVLRTTANNSVLVKIGGKQHILQVVEIWD